MLRETTLGAKITMKRLISTVGLVSLVGVLSACEIHIDGGDYTKGSGDAETKSLDVGSFDQLVLRSSADVKVTVGEDQSIELTTDDNLIEMFTFEVDGNTLIIDHDGSYSTRMGAQINISVPSLEVVALKGSGEVSVDGVRGAEFIAVISGSGDVVLTDVNVNKIELEVNGSGDIVGEGQADLVTVEINGSGDVNLLDLAVKDARVKVFGSGDIEVNASDNVDARVKGSGDIRYKGSPKVSQKVNGSGDIEQI